MMFLIALLMSIRVARIIYVMEPLSFMMIIVPERISIHQTVIFSKWEVMYLLLSA